MIRRHCEWMTERIKAEYPDFQAKRAEGEEFYNGIVFDIPWQQEVEHVLWMLEEIPKLATGRFTDDGQFRWELEKSQRWVGFVRGWGWKCGFWSINELREQVRPGR